MGREPGPQGRGGLQANPNDCYARSLFGPTLFEPDDSGTALDAASGPTGQDGGGARVRGGASWRNRLAGVPDLSSNSLAYDPAHGWLIMVNGDDRTILFDGKDWSFATENEEPSDRVKFATAYDRNRGRAVLFGGQDNTSEGADLCDTWELGAAGWIQVAPCGPLLDGGLDPTQPSPRSSPCLTYDPNLQQVVLVSGYPGDRDPIVDTWGWNGSAWTPLPFADAGPGFSCVTNSLIYLDGSDGGRLVMMGAPDSTTNQGSPTWSGVWDGHAYQWSQALAPLTPSSWFNR